ncbi:MAG: DUF4364 family protein [Clostridia bacterium]|nr:DUF4364 family protein [Clostridia bacterium]
MAVIPLTDPGDIKLYILCVMQKIGYPLSYPDINDLALYEGVISNMDFIEAFDALERDKLISEDESGLFSVTEDGQFIAKTLKSELSGYISDRSLRAAVKSIDIGKAEIKKNIKITETEEKKFKVDMSLSHKSTVLIDISLTFDTMYQAQKAAGAFSEDPVLIYTRLISLLGGA